MAITFLKNSNSLAFFSKNQWVDEFTTTGISPNVVLLSAWEESESDFYKIKPLVEKLIYLGCKYFVCAGKYSESLHDFIDNVILDMSLTGRYDNGNKIMTSWHDTDTDNEVADFFLHATNVSNSLLAAFFDESKLEDKRLKNAILNLAGSDQ